MRGSLAWVPNALSLSRIPLGFVFVLTFDATDTNAFWFAIAVLTVGFATDFLDGRLARFLGTTTRTGYFLDGLGDKVLYAAVLIVISQQDRRQMVLAWMLIVRELLLYAARLIDPEADRNIAKFRFFSWAYALSIWAYFGTFLWSKWGALAGSPTFATSLISSVFGYLALTFGALHLSWLMSSMTKQT